MFQTNSITQGEQVGVLWQYLLDNNAKIHFAHRTFKWTNEARGKAAVYCVIVGFASFDTKDKRLFDYETPISQAQEIQVKNINPYLVDYDDLIISRRQNPLSDIPEMNFGNMPLDGGNLIISSLEEKQDLLKKYPSLSKYIKKFTGSNEFLNTAERWCLWFVGIQPNELRAMPDEIKNRIEAVKSFRENSKAPSTQKFANIPYLFRDRNLPKKYLLVPSVSSERRIYIPIGFLTSDYVTSNLCLIVPDATIYHFGVLTSLMHNAWMRQVCGRLKSDYRYSKHIVYNNFPFPKEPTTAQSEKVEQTAQSILDARAKYPDATLADLYDPLSMPKELVDAHRANDKAIDACYGRRQFKNEIERLEFLFDLYRQYTEPLKVLEEKETRKAKRKR